jgi:DNA mismatch repair protein MutS2
MGGRPIELSGRSWTDDGGLSLSRWTSRCGRRPWGRRPSRVRGASAPSSSRMTGRTTVNPHALDVLEFGRVLDEVAARATSSPGRARVLELVPAFHLPSLQTELRRVEELARFLERRPDWKVPEIPDARAALKRLAPEGSVLEPGELYSLGVLLAAGRELKEGLSAAEAELPGLGFVKEGLHRDPGVERTIRAVVDRGGAVLDSASRDLARIRRQLGSAHGRIVQALEKLLRSLPERLVVPDGSVTIREGRYVIPVRREGRGEVGGVVMDESATGATLFMEPPVALHLMNELRDLERQEAREIQRILRERTEALRPSLLPLEGSQEALVVFDSLLARARTALAWEGRAPEILPPGTQDLEIVEGRHPLLLSKAKEGVVPFHLVLEPGERALVVSGPNTGGKSVFLKALGLIAVLAQSGIVPPVGKGTRLPLFHGVFADIGDEQSIAESLSTFSAHLANLKEIVAHADGRSLVLIDEMGTGTDPQEGAALARSILEELVNRGALAVVTSHLGALKRLDSPGSGVVNASLQFDPDRIEPTYQFLKGRPGRSYGLAVARRLGFPSELLDRAEGHVPRDEARMEEILSSLERKEKEASAMVASLSREKAGVESLLEELQERERVLRAGERTAEARAREEARTFLMEARQEVEDAIREVRLAGERALEEDALEEASRRARRRVEDAAQRHRSRKMPPGRRSPDRAIAPGDRVSLSGSGPRGTVVEIRDDRAVVETAGVRLQVAMADLVLRDPSEGSRARTPGPSVPLASSWQGPEAQPRPEVDLRGFRVADVDVEVDRALDQAVLGGLGEIRIIHGKGTGALRERVGELLAQDGRVVEFRMGLHGEGGGGVTVVRLR